MKVSKVLCIAILILGVFSFAWAQESERIATIIECEGKVEVKTPQSGWIPAQVGMALHQGEVIQTKQDSRALLNLNGMAETAIVEVKQNSQLQLAELMENKLEATQKTLLDLAIGEILIKAKELHSEKSSFEVKTPTSIVGVRGTAFSVTVEAKE